MLERLSVGIDIGGTKVGAGVVDETGHVLERMRRDTPTSSPAAVEDTIAEIITELRLRHRIYSVGIGAAGSWTRPAPRCCSLRTWPGGTSRCATPSGAGSACR
jgi:predicted NBD/HSP70 family sugar kinase